MQAVPTPQAAHQQPYFQLHPQPPQQPGMYIQTAPSQPQQPQYVPVPAQATYTIANTHPGFSSITPSTGSYGFQEALHRGHIASDSRPSPSVASAADLSFTVTDDGHVIVPGFTTNTHHLKPKQEPRTIEQSLP